ncbi:DUF952 domain-containing protein [Roseitranquillus sediminis]|uniref:DUF952 domain-containing protein n=1 Tax=Roseitranquillus sediminis TaxID=2809051 RepID=UPI001D0C759C|nr:DUF952 domain-containing protein [Roseitranquillus sediminis]MBM9594648.1 DUF952 domain-containing protein [Roseitranquillus sediminis]
MLIYKILREDEWRALERDGQTDGAPVDVEDGFIHFSTAEQVSGTLAKHFQGEAGLWLLSVEADRLGDALKWEPARGGEMFPHLYRPLERAEVERAVQIDPEAPLPHVIS